MRSNGKVNGLDVERKSCLFTRKEKRLDLSGLCMEADYIVHFYRAIRSRASTGSGSIEVVSHIAEREAARLTARDSDREFTKRHFQYSKAKLEVSCAFRSEHLSTELVKKEEGAVGFRKDGEGTGSGKTSSGDGAVEAPR